LNNPGESGSPNKSVPNPGTGNAKGSHNARNLRENLKEGMKNGEGRDKSLRIWCR
jgi:hypothetical protein